MSSDAKHQARVGAVIGSKYRLVRLLGAGGMGAVYEAENTWIKRRVALKILRADLSGNDEVVQRFTQEAQAASQIEHPNIVYVLDMGQEPSDGALYIVQEYLTGGDLREKLALTPRLSQHEALSIIVPIIGALVAAHERGIVHRDIKPENILLPRAPNGEIVPKLIDFGVSKVMDTSVGLTKTREGMALGTPYYMSPEQGRGDTTIDARADIWSVGIVMFEMLAGAPPFEAPNYNLLILKILTERPPRVDALAPDVSVGLADIVQGALEPDRDRRFPTMRSLLDAVLSYANGRENLQIAVPATGNSPSPQLSSSVSLNPVPPPSVAGLRAPAPATAISGAPFPAGFVPMPPTVSSPGLAFAPVLAAPSTAAAAAGVGTLPGVGGAAFVPVAPAPSAFGPRETALGWTHPTAPSRGTRIGLVVLACVIGLGASTGAFYAVGAHRKHARMAAASLAPPPSTSLALRPASVPPALVPAHVVVAPVAVPDVASAVVADAPAAATVTNPRSGASRRGATTRPVRGAHGAPVTVAPVRAPPPAATVPAPAPARPAVVPADPIVSQGFQFAQQMAYASQQYAAYDPNRARRVYADGLHLHQETNQLRVLDAQAAQLANMNSAAASSVRDQVVRQRTLIRALMARYATE